MTSGYVSISYDAQIFVQQWAFKKQQLTQTDSKGQDIKKGKNGEDWYGLQTRNCETINTPLYEKS